MLRWSADLAQRAERGVLGGLDAATSRLHFVTE